MEPSVNYTRDGLFVLLLAETAKVTRTLDRMTERVDAQLPIMLEQTRESIRALRGKP